MPSDTPVIRRLSPTDAAAYRALMLDAYERHPDAFTSSASERAAEPIDWWVQRLRDEAPASGRVIGAFDADAIVGVAGWSLEPREKVRHKALLFGMYVRPERRAAGIGRALVEAVLSDVRTVPDVRAIRLTVTAGNRAAQALYESCGFTAFGLEPMAMRVGERFFDKLHMWRPIDRDSPPATDPATGSSDEPNRRSRDPAG